MSYKERVKIQMKEYNEISKKKSLIPLKYQL